MTGQSTLFLYTLQLMMVFYGINNFIENGEDERYYISIALINMIGATINFINLLHRLI